MATDVQPHASDQADIRSIIRDSAIGFAQRGTSLKRMRDFRGVPPGYSRDVWRQMAELGWTGILMPEAFGGLGLGLADMAIVLEELAKQLAPEPLNAGAVLAARALVHGSNDSLKAELLPQIVAGTMIPALAWQEGNCAIDPLLCDCRAETQARGNVALFGNKRFVVGGLGADGYVVTAKSTEGLGVYWVSRDAKGLKIEPQKLADGSFAVDLHLDGVNVECSKVISPPGANLEGLQAALDEGAVMCCAELFGVLSRALDITLDYLRTRVQFDHPIGSFQALQHRAVDLYIQKTLSAVALEFAIRVFDTPSSFADRAASASRAKSRCSDAALLITRQAIQMHGAIGFTDECDIGLYLKRALVLAAWLGNATSHRKRYAELVPLDPSTVSESGNAH